MNLTALVLAMLIGGYGGVLSPAVAAAAALQNAGSEPTAPAARASVCVFGGSGPVPGRATIAEPTPAKPVQRSTTAAKPVQKSTAAAKPAKQCRCFSWVHLEDFGRSCHATAAQCEQAKAKGFPPGRGGTTPCQLAPCE